MATIVLSAVGHGVGAAIGGSAFGLAAPVIGRAVGATVGRMIDERVLGGSASVEHGKVERFHLQGASEGSPVAEVFGRVRLAGQVIWASRFLEDRTTGSSGGKGGGGTRTTTYSNSVSLAVALCEGPIQRVSRIWADGREIALKDLSLRVYKGTGDQMPDPKMEAVEGAGNVPAYRGTAYVVIEDLELGRFGNRVPQLNFEVLRMAEPGGSGPDAVAKAVRAVALVPGTGEYALATTAVHFDRGLGATESGNVNTASAKSDFTTAMEGLEEELPNAQAVSLVVSWFGDDLRAGNCSLKPMVEQAEADGKPMPWTVSGQGRAGAGVLPQIDGRPVYGGTPADAAVVEAIAHIRDMGKRIMFYPFILMTQLSGNALTDPYSGAVGQPELPWRGRITTGLAPGVTGTTDKTAAATVEVAAFFGTAQVGDFVVGEQTVAYTGPAEWSFRRFILHYAHLCALAGGVDAFCIGSEMRGLTRIRDGGASFPAVQALIQLAADVRSILGPSCKISYAADWSEYFGYHPGDGSGDVFFHLDPLWSDDNIDFIGIDNYMPLSDWREGDDHADAQWGSIYSLEYLKSGILGGKNHDWFYGSPEEEAAQIRTPIDDTAYGEDWVFRVKDLPNWWRRQHFDRPGGVRSGTPTNWEPMSKPIWFTEMGCAAVDKGTNEPNRFLDPKSSESALPRFSNGRRDDLIQAQYLRAMTEFWSDPMVNPVSDVYGATMVDMSNAYVWAFDTRPYPHFPAMQALWADGDNYARGHWISGRLGSQSLAGVVAAVCERAGVQDYDVSELHGSVRGVFLPGGGTGREALQPLMLAYGFDAVERFGKLVFRSRTGRSDVDIAEDVVVAGAGTGAAIQRFRARDAEIAGRIRVNFVEADGDYQVRAAEAVFPDTATTSVDQTDLPLVLSRAEAGEIVERWLAESRIAREGIRLSLPPSLADVGAGSVVSLDTQQGQTRYRVDRINSGGSAEIEAVEVERHVYVPANPPEETPLLPPVLPALPVYFRLLDLPILRGDEVPHAPTIAVAADPWPGGAAVYASADGDNFTLNSVVERPSVVGVTLDPLLAAAPWIVDRGNGLNVRVGVGNLSSADLQSVLNGSNLAAIGDGSTQNWEVFQFSDAVMTGPQTWSLSGRLRGQAGTEALIPPVWPAGSTFVLLDGTQRQLEMPASLRGVERVYRVGPSGRPVDDAAFAEVTEAFPGVGLRPYAPVHLRATSGSGGLEVGWVRRTRVDGDNWQGTEVPVGEVEESYRVRVVKAGSVLREANVASPGWTYSTAEMSADGATAPFEIEVSQVSLAWGAGPEARMTWNG